MTRERRRNLIRQRRTAIGVGIAAAISFLAGLTDAIGLLSAGSFVSFMSGNTTRAAVALADGLWADASILLSALGIFVAGNVLGVVIAHGARRRTFTILVAVSMLLGSAAMMTAFNFPLAQFYLAVAAMGLVNAAVEHIEGLPIGLTYVTGALSRFGRGIGHWIMGDRRSDWAVQLVPWCGMLAGATCGALLERAFDARAFWFACLLSAALALTVFFVPPRLQKRMTRRLHLHSGRIGHSSTAR